MDTTMRTREAELDTSSGTANGADHDQPVGPRVPRQVIGRLLLTDRGANGAGANGARHNTPLAVFCHESPDSYVGGHAAQAVSALAKRGHTVHLFARLPFVPDNDAVRVHTVGGLD